MFILLIQGVMGGPEFGKHAYMILERPPRNHPPPLLEKVIFQLIPSPLFDRMMKTVITLITRRVVPLQLRLEEKNMMFIQGDSGKDAHFQQGCGTELVGDLFNVTENHQVHHMNIFMLQRVMCVLRITVSSESKVLKTDSNGISFFFGSF